MSLNSQDHASLLENLMVSNSDVIYFKDLESRFIKVNEACAKKHGMKSVEEMVGKSDFDFYAREHAEQAYAAEQQVIQTGQVLRGIEEKEIWADGHITWVSTTKLPLRDQQGKTIGTFGVSRDITAHKVAQIRARRFADEVRLIKEEMENDVLMAGELQKNFMPKEYPVFPEGTTTEEQCVEFLHRLVLCGEVSGDFCSFSKVTEQDAAVFICDVKGAGVRSALTIGLIRGIMQEISDLAYIPGAFLCRMNELLFSTIGSTAGLDATACLMTLNLQNGVLRFASAGHPMPILSRQGEGASWLCEDPDAYGPPLGRIKTSLYKTSTFQLQPGDAVFVYSDGLFSAANSMNHPFGLKRLLDSAQSLVGDPLEDIFDGLEGDARAFSKDGRFSDDVCMAAFQLKSLLQD